MIYPESTDLLIFGLLAVFPPKCCRIPIPIDICRTLLSPTLTGQLRAKEIEFGTPNRIYCSNTDCSTFIPPGTIRIDVATCVKCRSTTCTKCKKPAHKNADCLDDPSTQSLVQLAQGEEWQWCYHCKKNCGAEDRMQAYHLSAPCAVLLRLWTSLEDVFMPLREREPASQPA